MNEKTPQQLLHKNIFLASVIAISFIIIGISASYAYFTLRISGTADIPENSAGNLNISSTIENALPITAVKLSLINSDDYQTKGEKISFQITNHDKEYNEKPASNVKGKYMIKIVDMTLSKNLFSKYFKWAIVVNGEEKKQGDFVDENYQEPITISPTVENDELVYTEDMLVRDLTKTLINEEDAITLDIGKTDNIDFYIWLENDGEYNFKDPSLTTGIDQGYLMNGSFQGKLAVEAVPTR